MQSTRTPRRILLRLAAVSAVAALALTGCSAGQTDAAGPASDTADGSWPRTISTPQGDVELAAAPERIVSTSVTMTGTLLAIDAPVVASGATAANTDVADEQGFFTQWGELAAERDVKALYNGDPNAEAILAEEPDLVLISATGGDSAIDLYDQLNAVVPTVVVDYGDKSWQELAAVLGEATGHEADAETVIAEFETTVADAKAAISLPEQSTSALVYYADGSGANVWTTESAQGKLLAELGFSVAEVPESARGGESMGVRNDIVEVSAENLSDGLAGNTILLVNADDATVALVEANPLLAQHPAVVNDRVFALGLDTFRLDYFSSTNLVNRAVELFG